MRVRVALLLAALMAALPAAAPAQETTSTDRGTPLREHAGIVVLSRWERTDGLYRLAVRRAGGPVVDVPGVSAQADPFDVDIGPDTKGSPVLVVSLCRPGCDLFLVAPDGEGGLRPIRNVNTSDSDEVRPTVWRGRVAFVRRVRGRAIPYTRRLDEPVTTSSSRLATLPARRCRPVVPECRPVENARVTALELWGRWVGQAWTYDVEGASGFRQNEMRLTTIDRRTTRQLDLRATGEGGQALLAPSFASGRVAWYQTCFGDPDGCRGARRYTIRDGTYAQAAERVRLAGWAWDGRVQHRSSTDFSRTEPCGKNRPDGTVAPCALVRAPEPDWQRTDPWVPRG